MPGFFGFGGLSYLCVSFDKQWMPELRRFAPNVPIVLVGTKLGVLSVQALPFQFFII